VILESATTSKICQLGIGAEVFEDQWIEDLTGCERGLRIAALRRGAKREARRGDVTIGEIVTAPHEESRNFPQVDPRRRRCWRSGLALGLGRRRSGAAGADEIKRTAMPLVVLSRDSSARSRLGSDVGDGTVASSRGRFSGVGSLRGRSVSASTAAADTGEDRKTAGPKLPLVGLAAWTLARSGAGSLSGCSSAAGSWPAWAKPLSAGRCGVEIRMKPYAAIAAIATQPASLPTMPNTHPPSSRIGRGGRSGARATHSPNSSIATSPSRLPFGLATFHGGAGSRVRGAAGGLRPGGRAPPGRDPPRGRSLPGDGSGADASARSGAYFNGIDCSGSRSRVLMSPLNATLYATFTRSIEPVAFSATAYYNQNIVSGRAHFLRAPPIPAGAKTGRGHRARRDKRRATATPTRGRRRQRTPGLNGAAVTHAHLDLMVAPPSTARLMSLLPWCAWCR
jgi:hypothetical protein